MLSVSTRVAATIFVGLRCAACAQGFILPASVQSSAWGLSTNHTITSSPVVLTIV